MAARKQLFHPDEVRRKIQASQLCNRLHKHALGELELSQTQIKAIEILLRKSMPDLSAVNHSGQIEHKRASEMSDDELSTIAATSSEGTSTPPIDPSQLN